MALEDQYIDVQFHGGLDQHTSGGNASPPNTLMARNVHHRRPGAAGIRDKYPQLGSANIPDAKAMAGMPNGPVAVFTSSGEAWTVDPDSGEARDQDGSAASPLKITSDRVLYNDRDSACHSMAVIGDVAMYTWHYGPGDYDLINDGGVFGDAAKLSTQPQVMYMLKNLATDEVLVPPTQLFGEVASLYRSGDYITVNAVTATDGIEYFVVLLSYDTHTVFTSNEVFFARNRNLWAVSLDVDGVVIDTELVEEDILLWDSHCSPEQDSTRPFVYYFATNSSDNAELQLTSDGNGVVGVVAVGSGGSLTGIPPVSAWPSATDSDYTVRDLVSIYHDFDNGRVFFGWLDTVNYAADWDAQEFPIHVTSLDDQMTEAWVATPTTLWTLRNPQGFTGTYQSDMEQTLLPYNSAASYGSLAPPPGDPLNVRFAMAMMRGGWGKIDGSTDLTFMVHGVSPRAIVTANYLASELPAPAWPGFAYQLFNKTGDWYGVKRARVDQSAAAVTVPDLDVIEPNVLMATKPWTDSEGVTRCILSHSPPTPFGFGVSREAQSRSTLTFDGSISYASIATGSFGHIFGGEGNQSAYFVGKIPSNPEDHIVPEAVFLVDDAISVADVPTLWNCSMVIPYNDEYVTVLPIKSPRVVLPDNDTGSVNETETAWYGRTNYPSSGATVMVASNSGEFIPAAVVDDVVTVSAGALSYFDGVDMRSNAVIPSAPVYVWDGEEDNADNEINSGTVVGTAFVASDYQGNVHRSGEAIESKFFSSTFRQPTRDAASSSKFFQGTGRFPIPPLTMYKQAQRELDTLTMFGVANQLFQTQTAEISYFHKEPVTNNASPFYMETILGDGDTRSLAMASTSELQPELTNAALFMVARRDRVFFIDSNNPSIIRYSKIVGARTTVEYNANLQVRIPESAGGATALGVMDDKVIVFTKDKTYYFAGEGPNNLGEGAFTDPRPIASSHGCINPASVISTARGVFFQSRRGMMLLDRNLVTHYIGDRVERTMSTASIVSVVEDPISNEVRWFFDDGSVSHGSSSLVYNQDSDAWSIWTGLSIDAGLSSSVTPITSTFHEGAEYLLFSDGSISKQARDVKDLASGNLYIGTPWLSAGGRLDMMRVREMHALFELPTSFGANESFRLTVQVYYNYLDGSGPAQVARSYDVPQENIAYGTVPSGFADEAVQTASIRLPLDIQKCSSFRVRLQFSTSGSGYTTPDTDILLTNLGFVVASKPAGNKVPNNQSN